MNKQRMIRMLKVAKEAVIEAELDTFHPAAAAGMTAPITEGTQNLIGQLILAAVIDESGSSISMSLDKLEKVAVEIGDIATAIRSSR